MREIIDAIRLQLLGRFQSVTDDEIQYLKDLAADGLQAEVIRLRRLAPHCYGVRTILLAKSPDEGSLQESLRWACLVRENLREPETADLYIFLIDFGLGYERAQLIESDEIFCRKFVHSSTEDLNDFVSRTFLGTFAKIAQITAINDPLWVAIQETASSHTWMVGTVQGAWHEALKNKAGEELVAAMIAARGGAST